MNHNDQTTAALPTTYSAARNALVECNSIDECKNWSDKAAALASYARQAFDEELYKTAMRIKGRALRRYGQLLKEIEPAKNQHDASARAGTDRGTSRKQAAADAGLSERQMKNGIRAANIPDEDFEGMIECDNPPTTTALSEAGKKARVPSDLGNRTPKEWNTALHFVGKIEHYIETISEYDMKEVTALLSDDQAQTVLKLMSDIGGIHMQIRKGIEQ